MANPQISDYIKQARESGMADEQIKESLKASGWSEADINEAFSGGSSSASSFGASTSKSALSGLLGKKILVVVVGAAVVGGGAYYLFSRDKDMIPQNSDLEQEPSVKQEENSQPKFVSDKSPFACKDILPDSDFERIIGKKAEDFEFKEIINVVPDLSGNVDCDYSRGGGISRSSIVIAISWSQGLAGTTQNTYEGVKNYVKDKKELPGLGSDAYFVTNLPHTEFFSSDSISVLSTNKKYKIQTNVAIPPKEWSLDTFKTAEELARLLENKLSKY